MKGFRTKNPSSYSLIFTRQVKVRIRVRAHSAQEVDAFVQDLERRFRIVAAEGARQGRYNVSAEVVRYG